MKHGKQILDWICSQKREAEADETHQTRFQGLSINISMQLDRPRLLVSPCTSCYVCVCMPLFRTFVNTPDNRQVATYPHNCAGTTWWLHITALRAG